MWQDTIQVESNNFWCPSRKAAETIIIVIHMYNINWKTTETKESNGKKRRRTENGKSKRTNCRMRMKKEIEAAQWTSIRRIVSKPNVQNIQTAQTRKPVDFDRNENIFLAIWNAINLCFALMCSLSLSFIWSRACNFWGLGVYHFIYELMYE